jgi:hypothetical protein
VSQAQIKALSKKLKKLDAEVEKRREGVETIALALEGRIPSKAERKAFQSGLERRRESLAEALAAREAVARQIVALQEQRKEEVRRAKAAQREVPLSVREGQLAARRYADVAKRARRIVSRASWARGAYDWDDLANEVASSWLAGTDTYEPGAWPVGATQLQHYINLARRTMDTRQEAMRTGELPAWRQRQMAERAARQAAEATRDRFDRLDDFTDMNPMGSLLALHLGRRVYPRQPSSLIQGPRAKRGPMFDLFAYHGDEKRPGCPTCRRIYKLVGASVFTSEEQVQDEIDKLIPAYTAFRGA